MSKKNNPWYTKKQQPKPPPSVRLFHYTTAAGLIGIIKDQVLFATHADYLNDTSELKILSHILQKQISDEMRELLPRLIDAGALFPELMLEYGNAIYEMEAAHACRAIVRTINNVSPLYIASLCMHREGSEEYEHGLLSQWRGYGRGGFAIEFDEKGLDDLTHKLIDRSSFVSLSTRRVAYRDHATTVQPQKFKGLGTSVISSAVRKTSPDLVDMLDIANLLDPRDPATYVPAFVEALPFLKTSRFEEENEYRLVAAALRPDHAGKDAQNRPVTKIHFREGLSGTVTPYLKLFDYDDMKLPIKRIIVGPHRNQEQQLYAAELLIKQHNLDVPVVASDTTLRL